MRFISLAEWKKGIRENWMPFFLGIAGIFIAARFVRFLSSRADFFDPDRLYHFALFREMEFQRTALLRSWASVPTLGWDQFFADKEFLFHFLLFPSWLAAKDNGVLAACAVLTGLLFFIPYFAFPRMRTLALFLSIACLFHPYALLRFSLVRPHILAVPIFLTLILALVRGWAKTAFFLAACFALAYHATYLVIFCALVFLAAAWLAAMRGSAVAAQELRRKRNSAIFALLGLAVGMIANPYFPANLIYSLQTLALALHSGGELYGLNVQLGTELLPMPLTELALDFGALVGLVLATLGWFAFRRRSLAESFWPLGFICVVFWALSARSPRIIEYAIPLSVIFLLTAWGAQRRVLLALTAVLLLGQVHLSAGLIAQLREKAVPLAPPVAMIDAVLAPISPASRDFIFHTNWGIGPYLLYLRPSVQITELLDPTLLLSYDPARALLFNALTSGKFKDPAMVLREKVHARYALCEVSPLCTQLRESKEARLLTSTNDGFLTLFEILP